MSAEDTHQITARLCAGFSKGRFSMRTSLKLISLILLPMAIGCTSNAAHVQGKVTLNGQPASDGHVTFRAIDKDKPAFTVHCNIGNGQYNSETEGHALPFGNYEVRVAVTKKTGRQIPLPATPGNQMQDEIVVISDAEYNGPKTPLRYELTNEQASGTFDIEVPAADK
jgi:hypothetical protein